MTTPSKVRPESRQESRRAGKEWPPHKSVIVTFISFGGPHRDSFESRAQKPDLGVRRRRGREAQLTRDRSFQSRLHSATATFIPMGETQGMATLSVSAVGT